MKKVTTVKTYVLQYTPCYVYKMYGLFLKGTYVKPRCILTKNVECATWE